MVNDNHNANGTENANDNDNGDGHANDNDDDGRDVGERYSDNDCNDKTIKMVIIMQYVYMT